MENGLRLVYEPMDHLRSFSVGIWIYTGSRDETLRENGISHFLEHMLFKGTNERSASDIAKAFDSLGGYVNAFTSKEYTCFYAKVMDRHSQEAIDILSDMFFNATIAEEELAKERNVVLEEIRMVEDSADDVVHDDLDAAAYGNHPLGQPILGTEETVATFTREQLCEYMDRHYRPDNVVISMAGSIDAPLLSFVKDRFSRFSTREEVFFHETMPILFHNKTARTKSIEQTHLCFGFAGVSIHDEAFYAMTLFNQLLGGSMSSRLFQNIREERGLAYDVFSDHSAFRDGGMLTVYAGSAPEHAEEVLDAVMSTIAHLATVSVHEDELANVKSHVQGSLLLGLESTSSRMNRNGKNELSIGTHPSIDTVTKHVDAVTARDIQAVAKKIYEDDYAQSIISPDGKLLKRRSVLK